MLCAKEGGWFSPEGPSSIFADHLVSWGEGEPSTSEWGVLWNTTQLPGQSGYSGEPFQWKDCKMGYRTQQKLRITWTQSLWTNGKCPESSGLKWQGCDPSKGPFLLTLSLLIGGTFPYISTVPIINFCWLELSGDNVCNHITPEKEIIHWRNNKLFRRKTDPDQPQSLFGSLLRTVMMTSF